MEKVKRGRKIRGYLAFFIHIVTFKLQYYIIVTGFVPRLWVNDVNKWLQYYSCEPPSDCENSRSQFCGWFSFPVKLVVTVLYADQTHVLPASLPLTLRFVLFFHILKNHFLDEGNEPSWDLVQPRRTQLRPHEDILDEGSDRDTDKPQDHLNPGKDSASS